ncbi:MAG: hypothetical protein M3P43_12025, partial [Actinomycetota bacterium]|nr:hypothetical protein [Actinomycetota bacterium]
MPASYRIDGREHAHRDGKIQARPFLAKVARREVDDHPSEGPFQTCPFHRGADPVAGVVHGGPRQPGERERGEPPPHVCLDRHEVSADAEHRDPHDAPVHEGRTIAAGTDILALSPR